MSEYFRINKVLLDSDETMRMHRLIQIAHFFFSLYAALITVNDKPVEIRDIAFHGQVDPNCSKTLFFLFFFFFYFFFLLDAALITVNDKPVETPSHMMLLDMCPRTNQGIKVPEITPF